MGGGGRMNCREARRLLHHSLDDGINLTQAEQLKRHLENCQACRQVEASLKEITQLVGEFAVVAAPSNFTQGCMQQLPRVRLRPRKRQAWLRAISAAMLFLLIASPIYVWWTLTSPQLVTDVPQAIVQEGNRFVVPAGQVVRGNLTVYKGILVIHGEVQGTIQTVDAKVELGPHGKHLGVTREIEASVQAKLALALAELWEKLTRFRVGGD